MVCVRTTRHAGAYVLTMSTLGTILSFVLSSAVLFVGPRIAVDPPGWFGLLVVFAYLVAIPIGGLAGAIAGFLITRRLLTPVPII
jgi:hypothetical protein